MNRRAVRGPAVWVPGLGRPTTASCKWSFGRPDDPGWDGVWDQYTLWWVYVNTDHVVSTFPSSIWTCWNVVCVFCVQERRCSDAERLRSSLARQRRSSSRAPASTFSTLWGGSLRGSTKLYRWHTSELVLEHTDIVCLHHAQELLFFHSGQVCCLEIVCMHGLSKSLFVCVCVFFIGWAQDVGK